MYAAGSDGVFTEKDLAGLAAELGLLYEINYDWTCTRLENKSCTVKAWIKMKGLKSKRYAVFAYGGGRPHTKRHYLDVVLLDRTWIKDNGSLSPEDVRRVRDHAADFMVKRILVGCSVKVSKTRRVAVPSAGSVEELRLKLAVRGGRG